MENNNNATPPEDNSLYTLQGLGSSAQPDTAADLPSKQYTGSSFMLHAEGAFHEALHSTQGLVMEAVLPENYDNPDFQKEISANMFFWESL